uniref:NADH-plastoquinone oxidoreductase subunit K, chloroplastic n=1 Tax=Tanacetum cinerariifolium TaxID=118510 RepID=A0A6L2LZF8_TANCI|nr:NADH-plastoquinone oxidoreductase subunit K, chloroplastic [Tanacetum cinerariifolium]
MLKSVEAKEWEILLLFHKSNSYSTVRRVDKLIPVDVYLPGCLPKPEAIIDAITKLHFEEIYRNPKNNHGPPPTGPIPQNSAPDLQTMEELLQAPTGGVGDAIIVLTVLGNQFELKVRLLNLVTTISFHGFANDDPHSHI